MSWRYSPLWHISGMRPDEPVRCVVTGHRDRFGVEVEIVGVPSGNPVFIDAVGLGDEGYTPREKWPPVGTVLDAMPLDFMPNGELRLWARPSGLRRAGGLADMRFLPVARPKGESELTEGLAHAGLVFQGWHSSPVPFIPPELAAAAFHFPRMEGPHWSRVEFADPELAGSANAGWYRVARDAGLFNEHEPRFLLGVLLERDDPVARWAMVRLALPWDIMGAGGEQRMLGPAWCRPAFTMLSLNGEVIVRGDTVPTGVLTIGVRTPHHQRRFMDFAKSVGAGPYFRSPSELRAAAAAWLRTLT